MPLLKLPDGTLLTALLFSLMFPHHHLVAKIILLFYPLFVFAHQEEDWEPEYFSFALALTLNVLFLKHILYN